MGEQLGALIPALLRQIRHAPAAATRATAAECLLAAMGLPYNLLHPHRQSPKHPHSSVGNNL